MVRVQRGKNKLLKKALGDFGQQTKENTSQAKYQNNKLTIAIY